MHSTIVTSRHDPGAGRRAAAGLPKAWMRGSANLVVGAGTDREIVVDLHSDLLASTHAPLVLRLLVGRGAVLAFGGALSPPTCSSCSSSNLVAVWHKGGFR